jgi:hypothetical protein
MRRSFTHNFRAGESMAKPAQSKPRKTLKDVMEGNDDLALPAPLDVSDVVSVVRPTDGAAPALQDWVTALLIMHGVKARWVINYWLVSNKAGAESGISKNYTFDEVQSVLKDLAGRTARR